jgi:hypothetical protein
VDERAPTTNESDVLEELTSIGEGAGLEAEREEEQTVISAPFDPEKIDVITQTRTVDLLLTRLKERELDLSPEFQRRSNVWNAERKSALIESLLLRIPIPSLYVSEDKDGNYTVVDGLQRLCAISHFVDVNALNQAVNAKLNPLRLVALQSLRNYRGKSFAELPRPLQRRIRETELTLHVIRASTPPAVKFNIFSRINQGGLPLTAQEIRNAIYDGDWKIHVRTLAESEFFITATEHKIKTERMQDIELALRFVALHTMEHPEERPDDQNLDEFLNATVEQRAGSWRPDRWAEIDLAFRRALLAACKVFGPYAFRKYSGPNQYRAPINRGLFESETVALSLRSKHEIDTLAQRTDMVLEKLAHYSNTSKEFSNALLYATGRGRASNTRLEVFRVIFDEVLRA